MNSEHQDTMLSSTTSHAESSAVVAAVAAPAAVEGFASPVHDDNNKAPTDVNSPTAKSTSEPPAMPAKRASPWRRQSGTVGSPISPRAISSPTTPSRKSKRQEQMAHAAARKLNKVNRRKNRVGLDSVTVRIPLGIAVDLGVALERCRTKRIATIYEMFPSLKIEKELSEQSHAKDIDGEDDKEENPNAKTGIKGVTTTEAKETKAKRPEIPKARHFPLREDYASVLDYLEAKYVRGVMIDDEEQEQDELDEGQGSIYSETSFIDDTDLQRTVAEQVLAHSTTTKLELEDDEEFFVNVGNLEIEETDLTERNYDPLDDTKNSKPSIKRKRKRDPSPGANDANTVAKNTAINGKKNGKTVDTESKSTSPKKKASSIPKITEVPAKEHKQDDSAGKTPEQKELEKKALAQKEKVNELYEALVVMIKETPKANLPRKKSKTHQVTIQCPPDKKPGDQVTFANPHVPGQKLKVKIPGKTPVGGTFKVSVPAPKEPEVSETDHNKLDRAFYYKLEEFSRAYDDWCDVEGEYRKAIADKEFAAHMEKRRKFDRLVNEFPKDLLTPIDKAYLQKILRRARQNKYKREQTISRQTAGGGEGGSDEEAKNVEDKPADEENVLDVPERTESSEKGKQTSHPKDSAMTYSVVIPQKSTLFPSVRWKRQDLGSLLAKRKQTSSPEA